MPILPPLNFTDISILLAIGAIVLLITAQLSSPTYGQNNLTINLRKLRNVTLFTIALFSLTVVIKILSIIL